MCNLYTPPTPALFSKQFGVELHDLPWGSYVAPLKPGPYLKPGDRLEVGQWGMIPPDCKTSKPTARNGMPISTNNARRETLATAMTYRGPWMAGQRCLIPAVTFDEPYYPDHNPKAKSINWRFARADGELWMLAGLWAEWTDPETGEVVPSYTMITQNCASHPLLALMHRPEVDKATKEVLPAAKQDKRAVTPIEKDRWDQWLHGTVAQANALIQLPAPEVFMHGAADPAKNIPLPGPARDTQLTVSGDGLF